MSWAKESVLIAGGAGTIGSNLAKALAGNCKKLTLIDYDENTLEMTRLQLNESNHECEAILCDIRNSRHLIQIFKNIKPTVIVNCAAHKHLNAGERNISECVYNNLETTKNLLHVLALTEATNYIHISTDKAVEPTSVMGASKMLCECMVRDFFSLKHFYEPTFQPKYHILRFGNILGSQGSVWEIWERQYKDKRALTITDPNMERYILLPNEACHFISRSLFIECGTYLLDMTRKSTVGALKERFLESKNNSYYPIKIIGSKPGEKMKEELFWPDENKEKIKAVNDKHIWRVTNTPYFPYHHIHWISKDFDDKTTLKALQRAFPKVNA